MDEKIKINYKKKAICNVKIGDETIKVQPWLEMSKVAFIVDESCAYFKDLISQNQSDAIALSFTIAKMNMLVVALATNIDLEDVDADTVGEAGIFNVIKEKVLNYDSIKDAVIAGTNMVGNGLIIEQLGNIASLDDLQNAETQIEKYMNNDEYSEKIKGLIEVMLANNPRVADELDKTLGGESVGDKE